MVNKTCHNGKDFLNKPKVNIPLLKAMLISLNVTTS